MYLHSPERFGEPAQPIVSFPPPPFPNLAKHSYDLHQKALAAKTAVDRFSNFKPLYLLLANAVSNAHLALDRMDQIVVVPDEKATTDLLGEKLLKDVLKRSGKTLIRHLTTEDFGRALGILDLLLKLHTALSGYDNKRLVNEQNHSRRDEAYRYKLRFFIQLWIANKAPQADRVRMGYQIEQTYFNYQKALSELWKYENMEKNLASGMPMHARQPPVMRSYPR
jgi:hypothetical protein